LRSWLPEEPSRVLDLGCGTGSLALLAAEAGHEVTAVDLSPRMAERARAKLAGTTARVLVGDAARPPVEAGAFDVVLVRHLVWTLPDPVNTLRDWARLLRPGGRLVLIEGRWAGTGEYVNDSRGSLPWDGGVTADALAEAVAPWARRIETDRLREAELWGREIDDDRYAMVVRPAPPTRHTEVVDVHLIVRRGEEVLLARRSGTGYADGLLNAPSGHAEDGEDVREAMVREAREEIGLDLAPEDLRVALVMQHCAPGAAQPRMGWFFEAVYGVGGEPVNLEPHKCSELGWFPLGELPHDMVAYCRAGLDAYREGHRFALHWHRPGDSIAFDPDVPRRAVVLPTA
jgi:SAM-dependent methyltransferase